MLKGRLEVWRRGSGTFSLFCGCFNVSLSLSVCLLGGVQVVR